MGEDETDEADETEEQGQYGGTEDKDESHVKVENGDEDPEDTDDE